MVTLLKTKNYAECLCAAAKVVGKAPRLPEKPVIVFSEDRLTLSLERAICNCRGGGVFNVTVSTFSRYLSQNAVVGLPILSKEGAAMAVRKLLSEIQSECFSSPKKHAGLAPALYELIAQIKSACVSPEELASTASGAEGVLKRKLDDIIAVYRAYEDFLAGGYCDESSYLSLLPAVIEKDAAIAVSDVYVVGYPSFTRQGETVLTALMRCAKSVTVICAVGENQDLYTGDALDSCYRAASYAKQTIEEKTWEEDLTPTAQHLANNLFNPAVVAGKAQTREATDLFIYEADSFEAEGEFVARAVVSAVQNGARYRDIAVLVGSEDGLYPLKNALSSYGIPYFSDERYRLSAHPLLTYVFQAMETARRGCDPKDLRLLAKNPLMTVEKTLADRFENYLLKSAITRKTIRSPFVFSDQKRGEKGEEFSSARIAEYEALRAKLLAVVDCFPRQATAKAYAAAVRRALLLADAQNRLIELEQKMQSLKETSSAAVTAQVYERLENILCETETVLGDVPLKLEDYLAVLRAGGEAAEIATIPLSCDAVFVGRLGTATETAQTLFAVGLTADVPSVKADTAILSDRDLAFIADYRVLVEPTIRRVNRQARESAGLSLTAFSRQLYLSYPLIGKDGKATRKSELVDYATRLFTRGGSPITAKNSAFLDAEWQSGKLGAINYESAKYAATRPALLQFARQASDYRKGLTPDFTSASSYYDALSDKTKADAVLSRTNVEMAEVVSAGKLLSGSLSASALENYFACPYRYFMEKGLRLEEREEGVVRPIDSGSLMHAVVEIFLKNIDAVDSEQAAKQEGERLFDQQITAPAYARFCSSAEHRNLFMRLRQEAGRVCAAVYRELNCSAFRPLGQEVSFGYQGDAFSAVNLNVKGKKIPIRGKIDRVDEADGYVRVIDYKTGTVKEKEAELYSGCKLQLYLYANAFTQDGKYQAAGCYYFPVADEFIKEDEHAFRMLGRTIEDAEVALKMDKSLSGGGKSQTLNFEVTVKEGGAPQLKKTEAVVSQDQLNAYLRYAVRVSEGAAEEIMDGHIRPLPASESVCEYCAYYGTCRREERGGVRDLPSTVKGEFLEKCLESEQGGDEQ